MVTTQRSHRFSVTLSNPPMGAKRVRWVTATTAKSGRISGSNASATGEPTLSLEALPYLEAPFAAGVSRDAA